MFKIYSNIKLNENPSSGRRIFPCGESDVQADNQTYRQTVRRTGRQSDVQADSQTLTKLVVIFAILQKHLKMELFYPLQ